MRLATVEERARKAVAFHCSWPGCGQATRERKLYCSEHVLEHGYAAQVVESLAQLEHEATLKRPPRRSLLVHEVLAVLFDGPATAVVLRQKLRQEDAAGATRLLEVLERRGLVRSECVWRSKSRPMRLWDLQHGVHARLAAGEFSVRTPEPKPKEATVAAQRNEWTLVTHRELAAFVEASSLSYTELAKLCGVSRNGAGNWIRGKSAPTRGNQARLRELIDSWRPAKAKPAAKPKRTKQKAAPPVVVEIEGRSVGSGAVVEAPTPVTEPLVAPFVLHTHQADEEPLLAIVTRRARRGISRAAGWLRQKLEAVEDRGKQGRRGA